MPCDGFCFDGWSVIVLIGLLFFIATLINGFFEDK